MQKRMIALLLAVLMVLSPLSGMKVSAAENDIAAIVRDAYNAFASANNVESGSYHGTMQILNHALKGKGKDFTAGEGDAFTALILNSMVCKTAVTEGLTAAFEQISESCDPEMYISGGMEWYDGSYKYYLYETDDQGTEDTTDDVRISTLTTNGNYSGGINSYDEALCLVAGGTSTKIRLERLRGDENTLTYQVRMRIHDHFDFVDADGKYTGHDDGLASAINLLGLLLSLGGSITTFYWEVEVDFEITIPNRCAHETADYRWDHDGTAFHSTTLPGFDENLLTAVFSENEEESSDYAIYRTDRTVHLEHTRPWVVEFRMKGSTNFVLGPDENYTSGNPCIFKTGEHMVGGYLEYCREDDQPEPGAVKGRYNRYQYGVQFSKFGYKSSAMHTYRLENRIEADGSNMVWLIVDGQELGSMDNYYFFANGKTYDREVKVDWFNGMDIDINYLLSHLYRDNPKNFTFEYIQIWENGEGNSSYSYYKPKWSAGSCAQGGTAEYTCQRCGAIYTEKRTGGHCYDAPVFHWDEKGGCVAEFTCLLCGQTQQTACEVTSERHKDLRVYTAVTELDGVRYSAKKTGSACTHETANYRWDHDGTAFHSTTLPGFDENLLTAVFSESGGEASDYPVYQTNVTAHLDHTRPWVVEFRMKGSTNFVLGPDYDYTAGNPCIFKTAEHMVGGYLKYWKEVDPETGATTGGYNRYQYGVQFRKFGYKSSEMHTYRLENRVEADGSNMVWLIVDGQELGAMDHYYFHSKGKTHDEGVKVDWFNGMDIDINYLLSHQYRDNPKNFTFEYIQIWENGEGNRRDSFLIPQWSSGSCAKGGTVMLTCECCGTIYKEKRSAGHCYDAPVFRWDEKGGCVAEFTCLLCDQTQQTVCEVTLERHKELLLYTAVTELDGVRYSAKKTVSAPETQPGDINGDGTVNNRDAARLMQYLAGWDVEFVEDSLDVNGDGKVNNRDAARLMQYLAGWDVELYG